MTRGKVSAEVLASAVAYLSDHSAGLGIYPSFDNAEDGWGIYACHDGREIKVSLPTFGEVIVEVARALGWHPPEPVRTFTREEVLAFGERVRDVCGLDCGECDGRGWVSSGPRLQDRDDCDACGGFGRSRPDDDEIAALLEADHAE